MRFSTPPSEAAWRHLHSRDGFEVVFLGPRDDGGWHIEGTTTAAEAGRLWSVVYDLELDADWNTLTAQVTGRSSSGRRRLTVLGDGRGHWQVNGEPAPQLDGCLDVDLESSVFTNALPIHRLGLQNGQKASARAVYVRALELRVERLEQQFLRVEDDGVNQRFDYQAPSFRAHCQVTYDASGLVLTYPGIARRVV